MDDNIGPLTAFVLGVLQGLTEYLPVSSSGHLVIAQNLFGISEPELFFDVILHVGTLLAVIWYYWSDITNATKDAYQGVMELKNGVGWSRVNEAYPGFRLFFLLIVATIPTGLLGVLFQDEFEAMFGSVRWVGFMLLVTGTFLFLTRFTKANGKGIVQVALWEALLIGIAQGFAITPGISRSGATICVALFLGIGRETAARFSFLLSIPAIVGALILKFDISGNGVSAFGLGVGFITSLIVGYAALSLLVMLVKKGKLPIFSYYCFIAGIFTLFYVA